MKRKSKYKRYTFKSDDGVYYVRNSCLYDMAFQSDDKVILRGRLVSRLAEFENLLDLYDIESVQELSTFINVEKINYVREANKNAKKQKY